MLYDELDHIIIDQALLVLKCIHKSFFTDPVDHTWDPVQIPLHRITDSASNGSVFPVVTEHFSASSDHAFL